MDDNNTYTLKSDIWSAGLVLVLLLTGEHPFSVTETISKLVRDIQNGEEIARQHLNSHKRLSTMAQEFAMRLLA